MTKDLVEIQQKLITILKKHSKVLQAKVDDETNYEVYGTIEAPQGKKTVDGIYFASVVPKPKDVRFYFFPLYTHKDALQSMMSPDLQKFLKGKTCFYVKHLTDDLVNDIEALIDKAVLVYQQDGLLAS